MNTRRLTRGVVTGSTLVSAALALVALAPPALSAGGRSSVPRCRTPALHASLGRIRAGLGNVGVDLFLRNTSTRTCSLVGYVGLGLQDAHHRRQHSRVSRGSTYFVADTGPRRLVLPAGARAVASLAWTDNAAPDEPLRGKCEPTSAWLEVTPPGERTHVLVRLGTSVCAHGRLVVTALRAARAG